MKWRDIEKQFFQATERLDDNIEYITKVGSTFEELLRVVYSKDPATCIERIHQDTEILGKIYKVDDPESIPEHAIQTSSKALAQIQNFLFTFLRVAALFNALQSTTPPNEELRVPPNTKFH